MSTQGGPKVVTNGLIFAVDAADVLSFRGENTTNLMPTITSWGSYVTTPTNVTVYDFPGNVSGPKTVKQSVGSSTVGGGGTYGGFYRAGVSSLVSSGETATVSFWVRSLSGNIACRLSNQNGAGDESNISFSFTATSSWTRVSNTATLNLSKDQFYIWNSNTASGIFQITDFQLEKKSYATTYTESSRGTTVATGGGWADMSNNSNHGELLNGTREGAGWLTFDGTDDYVDLGVGAGTLDQLSNIVTVQAMIYTGFPNNRMTIYSTGYTGVGLMFGTSAVAGGLEVYYPSVFVAYTNGSLLSANTWYHVAYTRSGTGAGTHAFYINGVSQALALDGASNFGTISTNKYIGLRTGVMWNGRISCVSVYNRALSAAEVLSNFNALRGRFGI